METPRVIPSWRVIALIAGLLLSLVAPALGEDRSRNDWLTPSFQTMSMDSSVMFTLRDYKNEERHFSSVDSSVTFALREYGNGERYFSISQGPVHVDEYFLKGLVLVKGYSRAELERIGDSLYWGSTVFGIPASVLRQVAPKGPGSINARTPFSVQLNVAFMIQNWALRSATGQLVRSGPNEVSYEFDVAIDPPDPDRKSIRYSGTMSFGPKQESPPDDIDFNGYMVVTPYPFTVMGPVDKRITLGELRRFLSESREESSPKAP